MNNKKVSPTLKKLYKPFQMIFGFSLALWFLVVVIEIKALNSVIEIIGYVFLWICVFFGYLGFQYILPIILSITLIFISLYWAISEKNIKNIFNVNLLITVALIIVSSVLQYNWLLQHF